MFISILVGCIRDVRIFITSKSIGFSLKESTQSDLVGWCLHKMYIHCHSGVSHIFLGGSVDPGCIFF